LEFDCVALKFEVFLRFAPQFNVSSSDGPLIISFDFSAIEEGSQRNLLGGHYGCIRDQWKNGGKADFGGVFVIVGSFEKMIALSRRVAPFMRVLGHSGNVGLVAFPVGIVGPAEEGGQMPGIPGIPVEGSWVLVVEEESRFRELFRFDHLLFLLLAIILIPFNHPK
jgi:hypothetical protein